MLFLLSKVQCHRLSDLDYGVVKHEGVYVGHKATYTCNHGYKLVGESVRKCLYNGYWSGVAPVCRKSKLNNHSFLFENYNLNHAILLIPSSKVQCDYLDDLEYGVIEHEGVYVGDKATYTCDYGYKLVGQSIRKCQYNGYWSGEAPKCEKSKQVELDFMRESWTKIDLFLLKRWL